ncbi:MFS transporter [Brevibacillus centrosporus]|uniref:Predicted arabinose efflux permease, MFS family n=1 Tax=Brevibacillus centrosporus TaxID=54910 RepID=A0A1I3SIN3_9BACL|nr:MFS transporter [Brevibacillus centrosporus]SFJ57972.1 Predicted arabinose efflux permease, MFS family [Brevibacillus centrosporus]
MLHNRYVRTIIFSRTFLQLGVWIRNFAILLYVSDLTHNDPLYVSLISVVEYAPIFLFAIIGGTFADRWRPKRTMVLCDLLSSLSLFAVLVALVYGSWHALLLATLFSSIMSQFSQPSAMKIFKQHVPHAQLQSVMAMFQSLMAIFMVIGPVVGTYLYQKYGIHVSLILTGLLFFASGITLISLPRDAAVQEAAGKRANFKQELLEGLQYVWNNRTLRTLGGTFAAAGLAVGIIQPLMIFVAIENLGMDKEFIRWPLMINGAAMLVGGALIMGVAKKVKPQSMLALGLAVSTVTTIWVGLSHSVWITLLLQAVSGLIYPFIQVGINTMIMQNTQVEFIGRVGGAMTPIFMGMMVVGMSAAGVVKDLLTLGAVYTFSGFLFLIGALLLLPIILPRRQQEKIGHAQEK